MLYSHRGIERPDIIESVCKGVDDSEGRVDEERGRNRSRGSEAGSLLGSELGLDLGHGRFNFRYNKRSPDEG